MASKFKITDKDKGFNDYFDGLKKLDGLRSKVGIQGQEGRANHKGSNLTTVALATIHEFGTNRIPQRSFIRSTADENKQKYEKRLSLIYKKLTKNPKLFNAHGEMLKTGEAVRRDVIKKIKSNIPPPIKEETRKRKKGEGVALIDTGQLIGSISSVVFKK